MLALEKAAARVEAAEVHALLVTAHALVDRIARGADPADPVTRLRVQDLQFRMSQAEEELGEIEQLLGT